MLDSSEGVMPDLAELCRIHDISLELIRRSHDVDELLDAVLAEYEKRLREMSADTLGGSGRPLDPEEAKKLQALVMFAGQAVALKEKAAAATQLRRRAEELEKLNDDLERALEQEARTRRRLDDLLAALDAGIMVVGKDGRIQNVNRAASDLTGEPTERLVGRSAQPYLGKVDRGSDGKVSDSSRVMLVARRDLRSEPEAEVVLLSDVTVHEREAEERHRLEKFAELLKTLGVLSHKINNPLTSLMGRAQILRMKQETDPDVRKAAEVIEESAKRIAAYIRELAVVVKDGKEEALRPLLDMETPAPFSGVEKP
jgi:nitrogen fixation/metabolism regulation signal transduction histidine kinase